MMQAVLMTIPYFILFLNFPIICIVNIITVDIIIKLRKAVDNTGWDNDQTSTARTCSKLRVIVEAL